MDGEILRKVTIIAGKAHGSQKRKYTADDYIVHPIRVMELCSQYTSEPAVLSAALLHDVLEDTELDADELHTLLSEIMAAGTADKTLQLVAELTDQYIKKDYPSLNRKRRKQLERERMKMISPDAQTIKYADIIDNCREIVMHDKGFAKVFLNECLQVLKVIDRGNRELYRLANDEVDSGFRLLKKKNMA